MKKPTVPANEEQRLATLRRLELLDTPAEDRFDRITRTAQRLTGAPMAAVSLVDDARVWFKSRLGLDLVEMPRESSFDAWAVAEGVLVVPDAARDPRFEGSPFVAGPPKIQAYAGIAVPMPDGTRASVLSVMDRRARGFTREELEGLGDLVGWVQVELRALREARKQETIIADRAKLRDRATIDGLTQVHNRPAILDILESELTRALRDDKPLGLIIADLDHFKKVNDTHGHPAGDAVLKEAAKRLKASVRPTDAVGRYGGEEFLVVLPGANVESAARTAERIRAHVGSAAVPFGGKEIPITVSLGATAKSFPERVKADRLIKAADEALYRAKAGGRNRVEVTS